MIETGTAATLEGRDLLFISTLDYGRVWGSREVYASHLARTNRVFYVNPHYGPEQVLRRRWIRESRRGVDVGIREVAPNLHVLTPPLALPGGRYSAVIDGWNQDALAAWVRRTLEPYALRAPILWIYPPWADRLVGTFDESLALYFCIDHFSSASRGRKRRVIEQGERRLCDKVDLVLTITTHLERHLAPICAGRTPLHLVINGAPVEEIASGLSDAAPMPPELTGIPAPRLGFMGSLNAKVDLELVRTVAESRPDWHWVFLGLVMEEELDATIFSALRALPNVHLLGPRPRAALIDYERHFTISTVPLLVNEWSVNVLPLKFPEYLALGHPIVSTRLPELMPFADVVRFGANPEEWMTAIAEAIVQADDPGPRAVRLDRAAALSWSSRIAAVSALIRDASRGDSLRPL